MQTKIPNKLFFKIGEVAKITGVKPHVLRYWESEFKLLRPSKSATGQRVYQKRDVEKVFEIKRLLYEEKYTIAGAKKRLSRMSKEDRPGKGKQLIMDFDKEGLLSLLRDIKKELAAIAEMLEKP
jgi:DNA-binding transcriptional MerR regulator